MLVRSLITGVALAVALSGGHDGRHSLDTFELHPDFQIELIASEPLVADPVDMEIDEAGRLYVLEMHGYPDDRSGTDRIVLLDDGDGDGRMDESTVFADSLVWPMGIMRWKDGLLVTEPPNVLYLEDSDGDGRADIRKTILTGFHDGNPEADVNNPLFGLDNWIYLANMPRSESDVYFAANPGGPRIPQEASSRNVRFRLDHGALEAQSSSTQFGFSFDTWGRQLLTNNRDHIYQEIIASRYLERRPDLLVADASASISDHGAAAQVFPITEDPNPQILTDVGEITAACGITFYDGGAFPAEFDGVSFVGEPAHNLVHADRLTADGPALTASRIRPHTEFLASTDSWFRPVNLYVGPDGAVYVVDYYRQIIEGPEWIAQDVLESGDLYNGSDMGRIYRISARGSGPGEWTRGVELGEAPTSELVARLADPNIWWRRNAQRLLLDRGGREAVAGLIALARGPSAVGRLHAMWTLEGLGELGPAVIQQGLLDAEAGVRENAIQLAELHLDDAPDLAAALLSMRNDPDPRVRFQLLLTLGFLDTPEAAAAREELLFEGVDDKWVQIAALSAPSADERALLRSVTERYEPGFASFVRQLSAMIAAHRDPGAVRRLLREGTAEDNAGWQANVLEGLALGLKARRSVPPEVESYLSEVVSAVFDHASDSARAASLEVLRVTGLPNGTDAVSRALEVAADGKLDPERRARALNLIALSDVNDHADFLKALIVPDEPTDVQVAAVQALGKASGADVTRYALEHWPVLTPDVRDAVFEASLGRPLHVDRVELILDAIEDGTIQPADIGWTHKVTLMRDVPDSLKFIARDLITAAEKEREQEIVEYAAEVKEQDAEPERGRAIFAQQCAQCHKLGDVADGSTFGPDLMSVRGWKSDKIVAHVVQPNQSITQGYDYWRIDLKNGDVVQGIISSETANAVTVMAPAGPPTTIARRDIAALQDLNMSIMPADFADRLSPQEMADLTAFIRTGR